MLKPGTPSEIVNRLAVDFAQKTFDVSLCVYGAEPEIPYE